MHEELVKEVEQVMENKGTVTWESLSHLLPLGVLVVSGTAAFFGLQVQLTELRTKYDTEMVQLKALIVELRDDVKALRADKEANQNEGR